MDCLYIEIEVQSCLVGSVDQGLMKINKLTCWAARPPKEPEKEHFSHIFSIATLPGIFRQTTPKKRLQTFRPNYRLSIVIALKADKM